MEAEQGDAIEGRIDEIAEILDRWRASLREEVPIAGLLSRCPIAYKWKAPFRILMVREALIRRMLALGDGMVLLENHGHHVGARILLRCAVEATALLEYTAQRMDALVKGNIDWEQFNDLTMRFVLGRRDAGAEVIAVQILNALRDANRVYEGLVDIHEALSETVHPNYDGVVGSYVRIDREEHIAHFGDFAQERFGRMLVPYAGYVFTAFEDSYNNHWVASIEKLEQWLRDNDDRLQKEEDAR